MARLDAADVALPRRLEPQLAYLESRPDCVAVGGQTDMIDEDGDPFGWILNPLDDEAIVSQLRCSRGAILHTTVAFRAADVRSVGGYPPGFLAEDVDLFRRLAGRGRLANLSNHVCRCRNLEGSLSASWTADAVSAEQKQRARDFGAEGALGRNPEPRGEALQVARPGLAIHAGFDRTARKYYGRLVAGVGLRLGLRMRIASRMARSWTRRFLQAPPAPAP